MTTRFASGREVLVGRGIPQPVPIALDPAAYAGAFAYGADDLMYYCDGSAWIHAEGRRPQRVVSSAYTPVLADAGRIISISTGGVTIPAGVFSAGQKLAIYNQSIFFQQITPASGVTLFLAGTQQLGQQPIGPRALINVECVEPNVFILSGTGIALPNPEGGTFVAPGYLASPFVLSRAQAAGVVSAITNPSASGVQLFGADQPRFSGAAQRLLILGQNTNGIRNANMEGIVAGNPGTLPPAYFGRQVSNGITVGEIVGTGVEGNLAYADFRITGTVPGPASGVWALIWEASDIIAAATGEDWTGSWYWRLMDTQSGGASSWQMNLQTFSSGVTQWEGTPAVSAPTNAALASQRVFATLTLQGSPIDTVRMRTRITFPVGTHDITVRIAGPHLARSSFLSPLSLPPANSPGASTVGVDLVSAALANLGILPNGASTVLFFGLIPSFVPAGTHTIACLDDGTSANRIEVRVNQASGQLQVMRSLAGVSVEQDVGAVSSGALFRVGLSLDGNGRAAVSLNGGAAVAVTGGPASQLSQLRLGNISDASTPFFGEVDRLRVLPYTVSDTTLSSLTGAFP